MKPFETLEEKNILNSTNTNISWRLDAFYLLIVPVSVIVNCHPSMAQSSQTCLHSFGQILPQECGFTSWIFVFPEIKLHGLVISKTEL